MGAGLNVLNAAYAGGADPTGAADSTAAIQAALSAAAPGQVIRLPSGTYKTTAPLAMPPGVILRGDSGYDPSAWGDKASVIKPSAAFTGAAVITMNDVANVPTQGPRIYDLAIDGSALGVTADGILATGPVLHTVIEGVSVATVTGVGINTAKNVSAAPQAPFGWRVRHVRLRACAGGGAFLTIHNDSTWTDVLVLGCGGTTLDGFVITNADNTQFNGCRAEWSGANGFHITGAWFTGTGCGGCALTGCSTDRNTGNGVLIDGTAGADPIVITGLMLRRDGRNAGTGGGSFAGLKCSATSLPVVISGVTCFPGVDDTGTGTSSPQYGVSIVSTCTQVSLDNASLHAASQGLNNDGTSVLSLGRNLAYTTGPTNTPTRYRGGRIVVVKPGNTARTSVIVPAADPDLTVQLPANAQFTFRFVLIADGPASNAANLFTGMTAPASSTTIWAISGLRVAATGISDSWVAQAATSTAGTRAVGLAGVGTPTVAVMEGVITTAATAGTFALNWSQSVSNVTATTLYAGSTMTLEQVA
jgi:hypothetical protein